MNYILLMSYLFCFYMPTWFIYDVTYYCYMYYVVYMVHSIWYNYIYIYKYIYIYGLCISVNKQLLVQRRNKIMESTRSKVFYVIQFIVCSVILVCLSYSIYVCYFIYSCYIKLFVYLFYVILLVYFNLSLFMYVLLTALIDFMLGYD